MPGSAGWTRCSGKAAMQGAGYRPRQRVGLEILAGRPKDCCEVRASRPQSLLRGVCRLGCGGQGFVITSVCKTLASKLSVLFGLWWAARAPKRWSARLQYTFFHRS